MSLERCVDHLETLEPKTLTRLRDNLSKKISDKSERIGAVIERIDAIVKPAEKDITPKQSTPIPALPYIETEIEEAPKSGYLLLDKWIELSEKDKLESIKPIETKSKFNKQKNESIDWAKWSWNPVTGCRAGCPFCYARDIANHYYQQGFEPSFHPNRLLVPSNMKIPESAINDISYKNVFTCSMADLFGRWIPKEWIDAVLEQVKNNPQWNFLFLTKYPKRLVEFEFPDNAWLGATVDCQSRVKATEDAFEKISGGTKWLSIEPLLEPLKFSRLNLFDWVVIGGASKSTRTPEWKPPFDWIVDLHQQAQAAGCRVYHKANLYERVKDFPWGNATDKRLPDELRYLKSMQVQEAAL